MGALSRTYFELGPALPADLNDVTLLASIYAPQLQIDEPVLEQLLAQVRGSTRRVSTNLEMLNEKALEAGTPHITKHVLKELLLDGFVTGESPKPRSF
jgi:chromosomal replication initiation ATPase DnaA